MVRQPEMRPGRVAQYGDFAVTFGDPMWVDDVGGIRGRVAAPRVDVGGPVAKWRLIEYVEMVVFGHQRTKSVDVAPIDGVDVADDSRNSGQRLLAHGAYGARERAFCQRVEPLTASP